MVAFQDGADGLHGFAAGPAVREAVRSADPSLPLVDVTPVQQRQRELDGPRRFQTVLLGVFAACALLIAAVGLQGILSSSVEQRTREIGIRVAIEGKQGLSPRTALPTTR